MANGCWKPIKKYEVSNKGRVRSNGRKQSVEERILKGVPDERGYLRVGFSPGHISKTARGKYKQAYGYIWKYVES